MLTILVIGYSNSEPVGIYCGSDGVKAEVAESKARESGKFEELRVLKSSGYVGNRVGHLPTQKKSVPPPRVTPDPAPVLVPAAE